MKTTTIITAEAFNRMIEDLSARWLSVEAAKGLEGKRIALTSFGEDEQQVYEMTVGRIAERDGKLLLLDADGEDTGIVCDMSANFFDEPVFVYGAADTAVYYLLID